MYFEETDFIARYPSVQTEVCTGPEAMGIDGEKQEERWQRAEKRRRNGREQKRREMGKTR